MFSHLVHTLSSGPSHWRLNTSMLEKEEYVTAVKEGILPKWKLECVDQNDFIAIGNI